MEIYRVLYRNRIVVLSLLLLLLLSLLLLSFFCLQFWVRGNGSRADRSVSLERRERRDISGSYCGTERGREEEKKKKNSQLSPEKDRNKEESRKKKWLEGG